MSLQGVSVGCLRSRVAQHHGEFPKVTPSPTMRIAVPSAPHPGLQHTHTPLRYVQHLLKFQLQLPFDLIGQIIKFSHLRGKEVGTCGRSLPCITSYLNDLSCYYLFSSSFICFFYFYPFLQDIWQPQAT